MRGYLSRIDSWCERHQMCVFIALLLLVVFANGIVELIARLLGW